jgi:hypothetical protein
MSAEPMSPCCEARMNFYNLKGIGVPFEECEYARCSECDKKFPRRFLRVLTFKSIPRGNS